MPTWTERMEKQEESWEEFRPKILDEILKHSCLPEDSVSFQLILEVSVHAMHTSCIVCENFNLLLTDVLLLCSQAWSI